MKLSIVTPVLDSHEVVRRQMLHYNRMSLPDSVEVIYVDDGSEPPLEGQGRVTVIATHDKRRWTEHLARNRGAARAQGEYLLMADVDYIIPEETIQVILEFDGARMDFNRKFGILDEDGQLRRDRKTLSEWGLLPKWQRRKTPNHRSQYVMRKSVFEEIGGYIEDRWGKAHPNGGGAGQEFFHAWQRLKLPLAEQRPFIFMFPNGKYCGERDYNPFDIFHALDREP